jgi:hypothetical protein
MDGMRVENYKKVKVDLKGRVCLGGLVPKGVSSYKVHLNHRTQQIILEPYIEIPMKEAWLYRNSDALEKVKTGIKQSANNEVLSLGSFAEFLDNGN